VAAGGHGIGRQSLLEYRTLKEGSTTIRWGFVGFTVLTLAVLMRFTPIAYADGCEGGDSAGGHHAIAFDRGEGNGIGNGGHHKRQAQLQGRVGSCPTARSSSLNRAYSEEYQVFELSVR
jgi:hypothetical protein